MLGVLVIWIILAGLFRKHALLLYCTRQSQKREHKALVFLLSESCVNKRYLILNYLLKISVFFFRISSYLLLNRLSVLSFSVYFLVFILLLLSISSWDCKLSGAETVFFGLCTWSIQHSRVLVQDATWIQININNNHHHCIRARQAIYSDKILIILLDNYSIMLLQQEWTYEWVMRRRAQEEFSHSPLSTPQSPFNLCPV